MDIKFDFSKINIPNNNSRVYKDECTLCFDTPESEGGLNVCLNTFQGFCPAHLNLYSKKTGNRLFLNIKRIKKENPEKNDVPKPQRLAIGVEGGFNFDNKFIYEDLLSLVCLEPVNRVITLPNNDLPEKVKMAIDGIIGSTPASKKDDIVAWEGEQLKTSKYTENLVQLNEKNIKIPRSGWQCNQCDKDLNLWLCLTCGNIGCGRRYEDGSGGNNHAIEHHKSTGHPLVVKLGTITADGKADVWDYFANDLVVNPHLEKHLATFGINPTEMKKTDKSMAELTLDMNINFDSVRIQASGNDLFGPGFTGLNNLGNTCYMASVVQSLFNLPQFKNRYLDPENKEYIASSKEPFENLDVQLTKVANGLFSGKYAQEVYTEQPKKGEEQVMEKVLQEQAGITPRSLKSLVGKGHPEFSTAGQQDALEFLQWILQLIERNEATKQNPDDVTQIFKYQLEERYLCSASNMLKYKHRVDNLVTLPVPLDKAINKEEWEEYEKKQKAIREEQKKEEELKKQNKGNPQEAKVEAATPAPQPKAPETPIRPRVKMSDCIASFAEAEVIQGFYSSAVKHTTTAFKTSRLATFPDYLLVSVRRFILDGWIPRKLDVFIENAQEIDISSLRGNGPQPNEALLPEEEEKPSAPAVPPKPDYNEDFVQQLEQMGFGRNRCIRAVVNTKNAGVEAAMNWIFDNSQLPDIDDPLPQLQQASASVAASNHPSISEDSIQMLESMGFDRKSCIVALKQTNGNSERAIDWIFSHQDEIPRLLQLEDQAANATQAAAPPKISPEEQARKDKAKLSDGSGKYELIGFVSHIGSNTFSGHYVCHLKKEGKWTIFNDRKVSACDNPPFDMGYIYIYARK